MPAELEAKFLADGPEPLSVLEREPGLAGASLGPARTLDEVDRYLDTGDGRLAASGWACRLRERAGRVIVSLKGRRTEPAGEGGWLHRRPEVEGPAAPSPMTGQWPESDARALVERLSGGAPLIERFRLRQRRTERPVTRSGRALGVLSLDVVDIEAADEPLGRLFMVELEMDDADDPASGAELARLAQGLAGFAGLSPDPRTKLEHALERIGAA